MVHKSVGLFRNLFNKRKEVVGLVKDYLEASDIMIISKSETGIKVSGSVSSDAMGLYMIGTATGLSYLKAKEHTPEISLDEFLSQPTTVAITYLERNGHI